MLALVTLLHIFETSDQQLVLLALGIEGSALLNDYSLITPILSNRLPTPCKLDFEVFKAQVSLVVCT